MKEKKYTLPDEQEAAFVGEPTPAYHGNAAMVYPEDAMDEIEENDNLNLDKMSILGPKTLKEAYLRIKQAEDEYERGEYTDIEDFERKLEKKYPWLV